MKLRKYINPIFLFFAIVALTVSLSCANKQTNETEGLENTAEQTVDAAEAEGEELAENAEESATEAAEEASELTMEEEGDLGMKELEDELAQLDENTDDPLGLEEEGEENADATEGEQLAEGEAEGDDLVSELEGEEPTESNELVEADSSDSNEEQALNDILADPEQEAAEVAEASEAIEEVDTPEVVSADEAIEAQPEELMMDEPVTDVTEIDSGSEGVTYSAAPKVVSSTPTVPSEAIEKNGVLLNRFYFVRQGDDSASISKLLYGSPDSASQLADWNGGASILSRPGNLVYYSSPVAPQDTQMNSFYDERGIQPEQVTLEDGDWLSLVAKRRYGSLRSWREIAVINGLPNPDGVYPGQSLKVYPVELASAQSGFQQPPVDQVAEMEPPAEAQPTIQPPPGGEVALNNAPEPMAIDGQTGGNAPNGGLGGSENFPHNGGTAPAPPVEQTAEPTPPPAPKPTLTRRKPPKPIVAKKKGNDYMVMLQQNLYAILAVILGVILIAAYFVVKQKKRATDDEFHDQDFAQPPKAKRR